MPLSDKLSPSRGSSGALPARFRRPRLLVVGCGDVGLRAVQALLGTSAQPRLTVRALTSSPGRVAELRARRITPLLGDLDRPATLTRLAGLATHVLHLAPPPGTAGATHDPRSAALLRALRRSACAAPGVVYASTSGVYGDAQGAWIDETRPTAPRTDRARRRVAAESLVRRYGLDSGARSSVVRIPGIYAPDREGGTPRARLLRGTPVLCRADDVYTNHIHADDLARALLSALWRGAPQRIYHASDDTELLMGDYFDQAADLYGLPRPPRIGRAEALQSLPAMQLSFMSESRRLRNTRLHKELRVKLRYPTTAQGLATEARPAAATES
ncbi:nucleoside-diphosphate-sugar epimerase [Comamonas sp. BIGb0124]|uniref:SDR family oxidoreductase n=1 Tax=Comamonas sp. BIGb0124 TaxID=2485130 RepID=UPI000F46C5FA|nr:SDR family oxidoreductase [Comamonas sp. BIGb0124]ROR22727.1 nucleoside-diphosphate-sugar epimerase [Comamonas sp. BIGb0124]